MGLRHRWREWRADRAQRLPAPNDNPRVRAARDVVGVTGMGTTAMWDKLNEGGDGYMKSFEPKVPPSLHISHNDQTRHNRPVPLVERVIEDFGQPKSTSEIPDDARSISGELPQQEPGDRSCHSSFGETPPQT